MKEILLSGVKPTGHPHIGNYFGAMKQWIEMQSRFQCYFMIADYHGLNFIQNAQDMKQNTIDLIIDYLSIGLDPDMSTIFKQSDIPAHTELTWIFDTITTMPYLMRAHAFKDAEAKDKEISVGTFNYPMLMASDILLYDTKVVPVGMDQKQHIEFARDTAQKFNHLFGETFALPEPLILENVSVVPGTDGKKMSKSHGNTIPLFASRKEISKAVMGIVTDSSGEVPTNVYNIHRLLKKESEIKDIYDKNKGQYKILKEILIEDLDSFIKPMREKRAHFENNLKLIEEILMAGAQKANERASSKLLTIKRKIGVL